MSPGARVGGTCRGQGSPKLGLLLAVPGLPRFSSLLVLVKELRCCFTAWNGMSKPPIGSRAQCRLLDFPPPTGVSPGPNGLTPYSCGRALCSGRCSVVCALHGMQFSDMLARLMTFRRQAFCSTNVPHAPPQVAPLTQGTGAGAGVQSVQRPSNSLSNVTATVQWLCLMGLLHDNVSLQRVYAPLRASAA